MYLGICAANTVGGKGVESQERRREGARVIDGEGCRTVTSRQRLHMSKCLCMHTCLCMCGYSCTYKWPQHGAHLRPAGAPAAAWRSSRSCIPHLHCRSFAARAHARVDKLGAEQRKMRSAESVVHESVHVRGTLLFQTYTASQEHARHLPYFD